ncbi:MAG: putative holin [Pseudomonas sp.]|uniref:putative holin n=1 Tax=Pseudomonas abieticivorans TaxID=2931382 RepID=UPI0020C12885|nr:putative holin [Pseudomonas sp. PIA16]MDE1164783.1 putative holin [Pseudomonas sp.]
MADPASSSLTGILVYLGLASILPLIDGDALIGSVLGAWLVTSTKQNFKPWQRLASLVMSAAVGDLFAPLLVSVAPLLTSGVAAFIGALVVIPLSIKAMVWVDHAELADLLARFKGGR